MKKSTQLMFLAFILLMVLMSACAPASTPVPPTFTPSPVTLTFTPEPTATPMPTPTPTSILTDLPASDLYKQIAFDDFTSNYYVSLPLKFEIPKDYMLVEYPEFPGEFIWLPSEYSEAFKTALKTTPGSRPEESGFFYTTLSLNVGYDISIDQFINAPNDENSAKAFATEAGLSLINFKRFNAGEYPALSIEFEYPPSSERTKLYIMYIGMLLDTNTMLISYIPSKINETEDIAIWERFKTTISISK